MDIKSQRDNIRRQTKTNLTKLEYRERHLAATTSCAALTSSIPWREARAVLVYMAFGKELSADPVLEAALKDGKASFAPVVQGNKMMFRAVHSLEGPFSSGVFGIREPVSQAREWTGRGIRGPAIVVVPGLAFTETGGRIGRGGGYYDRFISTVRSEFLAADEEPPLFIGYCYQFQVHQVLPLEHQDEILDGLVTGDSISFF